MLKRHDARTLLAFGITLASVIGISLLSVVIVLTEDAGGKAQGVLNAVLPLFGTWVGTVLAYYFSRENFESASASTERLVRQLTPEEVLKSTLVVDTMITDLNAVTDQNQKVEDVIADFDKKKFKRIPILDGSGVLVALLHREDLSKYLLSLAEDRRSGATLADLLTERPELKQIPSFVNQKATLHEAREAMERGDTWKTVFVTRTGKADEPVLGMLTATDIARKARV